MRWRPWRRVPQCRHVRRRLTVLLPVGPLRLSLIHHQMRYQTRRPRWPSTHRAGSTSLPVESSISTSLLLLLLLLQLRLGVVLLLLILLLLCIVGLLSL